MNLKSLRWSLQFSSSSMIINILKDMHTSSTVQNELVRVSLVETDMLCKCKDYYYLVSCNNSIFPRDFGS